MSTYVSNVWSSSEQRASGRNQGGYTFMGPVPNVNFERVFTGVTWFYKLNGWNLFLWVSFPHRHSTTDCVETINPLNHIINLNWNKVSQRCTFSCTFYEEKYSFELNNQPKSRFGFVQGSALIIRWKIKRHKTLYTSRSQKCWRTRSVPHARESSWSRILLSFQQSALGSSVI